MPVPNEAAADQTRDAGFQDALVFILDPPHQRGGVRSATVVAKDALSADASPRLAELRPYNRTAGISSCSRWNGTT